MGLNSLGLGFLFTATDLASGVMSNVGKNFKELEEQSGRSIGNIDEMTKKLGAGLITTAVGVGGLAASFSLAGKASTFEAALAAVGAVSNATAAEMKQLEDAAIKAGKETQFSPTEAVQGLNELSQAGYNVKESIDLLQPSLLLAAGSLGDLSPAEAAGLASQGLKAFGIDAKYAGRMVDQLLQSANAFAVKPADLALGLGTVSSGAQTLNQSLTESVIAFGLVKNIIPGTERAATSVKVAMERLADPKVQKAMKAHHVSVLDANGGYRQFLDIIKDLMPQLDKMSEGDKGAFLIKTFGTEGLSGVNAMLSQFGAGIKGADGQIRKGGDAIDYLRKQFSGANGVAEDFSKKTLNTFEGSKKLLMGSMETLAIMIGKPFMKAWKPVVDSFTASVNEIIVILDKMSPSTKNYFAKVIVGGLAVVALAGAILLVDAAIPMVMGGIASLTTAVIGLGTSAGIALIELWPLTLIALLLGGVLYGLSKQTGGLQAAWDALCNGFEAMDVWNELKISADNLRAAFAFLSKQFGGTGKDANLTKIMFGLLGGVIGGLVRFASWLVVIFVDVVASIVAVGGWVVWLAKKFSFLIDAVKDAWNWMKKLVGLGPVATATLKDMSPKFKLSDQGKAQPDPVDYKARGHNLVSDVPQVLDPYMPVPLANIATQRDLLSLAQDQNLREQQKRFALAQRNQQTHPGFEPDYSQYMPSAASAAGLAEASSLHRGEGPIDYDKMAESLTKLVPFQFNVSIGQDKLITIIQKAQASQSARMSNTNTYISSHEG
jgi:TP901 family phage tail tape measure protein